MLVRLAANDWPVEWIPGDEDDGVGLDEIPF